METPQTFCRLYSYPESCQYRGYYGYQGYSLNPESDMDSYLDDTDSLSMMSNYEAGSEDKEQKVSPRRYIHVARTSTHIILTQSETEKKNASSKSATDRDNTCASLKTESIFDSKTLSNSNTGDKVLPSNAQLLPSNASAESGLPSNELILPSNDDNALRDITNKIVVETLMKHLAITSTKTDKKSKGFKKLMKKRAKHFKMNKPQEPKSWKRNSLYRKRSPDLITMPARTPFERITSVTDNSACRRSVEHTSHLRMSISKRGEKCTNISVVDSGCNHVHTTPV